MNLMPFAQGPSLRRTLLTLYVLLNVVIFTTTALEGNATTGENIDETLQTNSSQLAGDGEILQTNSSHVGTSELLPSDPYEILVRKRGTQYQLRFDHFQGKINLQAAYQGLWQTKDSLYWNLLHPNTDIDGPYDLPVTEYYHNFIYAGFNFWIERERNPPPSNGLATFLDVTVIVDEIWTFLSKWQGRWLSPPAFNILVTRVNARHQSRGSWVYNGPTLRVGVGLPTGGGLGEQSQSGEVGAVGKGGANATSGNLSGSVQPFKRR